MKPIRLLNVLALAVALVVNGLANALPLNGKMTGEISDSFPVLFTPAAYVFAIWGLIYLLLAAFAVYQALPAQRDNPRLDRIGGWFVAASFFNSIWIFLWHYELFPLTIVAMLGLLVSLLAIYLRLDAGRSQASRLERLLLDLPFSVYLGWISVATIANAAIFLYDLGWNGGSFGPLPWTLLVILVAASLGAAMIFLRGEVAYPLVLVWAFTGISVRQAGTPPVAVLAGLSAAALVALLAVRMVRSTAQASRSTAPVR